MVMANFLFPLKEWLLGLKAGVHVSGFVTSLVALGEVIAGIGVIVGGFSNHIGNLTTRLSGGHRSDYDRGACDSTC